MEILSSVVGAVISPVVNFIINQGKLVINAGKNVNALHLATLELLQKKDDLVSQIEMGEPWLKHVEAVERESDRIEKRYEQRSCQWFSNCSLNCFSNYAISRDAIKKCVEVKELHDGAEIERARVEKLPNRVQILATTWTAPSTINSNLELAHGYLNDDGVKIIGIWGMGGIGKTHLLKEINNSLTGNPSFDYIIFVTASKEWSVERVQKRIAERLKLDLNDCDDIKSRVDKIFNFLRRRKFILLLDDLWNGVDLTEVGIPFPLESKQKVVLTTRKREVCAQMQTNKEIRVDCLNDKDARRLFEENVGLETIQSNPNILTHVKTLVRKLNGLPLALITFGRAMRGKKDSREWNHVIQLLKKSKHSEIEENLFKRLKFSYDSLKTNTLRECFLACSLWPEDHQFRKVDLIRLWLGLNIVQELDEPYIYSTGYALISDLQDACLLEAGEIEICVKMHDVLRDMALWIAGDCGENMNKRIIKEKGETDGVLALDDDIWCKAEYITLWGYSKVVISSDVSRTNLKVLIVGRYTGLELNGIQHFTSLTFLYLKDNGLENFPEAVCQLVTLRYLDLSYNSIKALPVELKFLTNLRYLILGYNEIREIPSGVLSELKELIMLDLFQPLLVLSNIPSLLNDIESLKKIKALAINVSNNSELQRLSGLVHVHVMSLGINYDETDKSDSLLITSSLLEDNDRQKSLVELSFYECPGKKQLVFENTSQGSISWQFENLTSLELMFMSNLENVVYKGVVPKNLFPVLTYLNIFGCKSMKNFSWIMYLPPCLVWLEIMNAHPSVYELFTIEQGNSSYKVEIKEENDQTPINQTFPVLQTMRLISLPNVKSICSPHITFPSLKELYVWGCSIAKLPFNRTTVPRNLKRIWGGKIWWDSLEWEDDLLKSSLQNLFEELEY